MIIELLVRCLSESVLAMRSVLCRYYLTRSGKKSHSVLNAKLLSHSSRIKITEQCPCYRINVSLNCDLCRGLHS